MATTPKPPSGADPDVFSTWTKALGRVEIPKNRPSVAFTHIRSDHSALWMSKLILAELYSKMQAIEDGIARHLVYVVPTKHDAAIVAKFLEDDENFDLGGNTKILACESLTKYLEESPLPQLLRNAVVVVDTDFGRASTQLVAATAELLRVWAQLRARREDLFAALVAVSPGTDTLWEERSICDMFNVRISYVRLKSPTGFALKPYTEPGNLDWRLTNAVLAELMDHHDELDAASEDESGAVVACLVPPIQGRRLQSLLNASMAQFNFRVAPCVSFVITADTMEAALAGARGLPSVVFFVDPLMRFLSPVDGLRRFVLPYMWRQVWWDHAPLQRVEQDWPCDEQCALLAAGLGQSARQNVDIAYVTDPAASAGDAAKFPRFTRLGPAWACDIPETALCLVHQLRGGPLALSHLGITIPCHPRELNEALRLLIMMGLVVYPADQPRPMSLWDSEFRIAGPRASRVARLLRFGHARTLFEALLIVEIAAQPSFAVKRTLAAVASASRVDLDALLVAANPTLPAPTLEQCRAACTGPGAQLAHKGRLWAALGITASLLGSSAASLGTAATRVVGVDNLVSMDAPCADLRQWFRYLLARTGDRQGVPTLPDRLEEHELFEVEVALVTAWLPHLVVLPDQQEAATTAVGLVSGVFVVCAARGWGRGLTTSPGNRFGIHFGARKNGASYSVDALTLVSRDAVLHVLRRMFPSAEQRDYWALLRSRPPA